MATALGNLVMLILIVGLSSGASLQKYERQRIYYVSNTGDDANDGLTPGNAWRSIRKVNETKFNPGEQLLFCAGESFVGNLTFNGEDAGTPQQPVVVGSYGSGRATIEAGMESGITVRNAGGFVIRDLRIKGWNRSVNQGNGIEFVNASVDTAKMHHIRIDNCEISSFGKHGILLLGGTLPVRGTYVIGSESESDLNGYEDVLISNCKIFENLYTGVLTLGAYDTAGKQYAHQNVTIRNCEVFSISGDPNYYDNHSGSGILLDCVDNGLVEYCTAYNNGYDCYAKAGGPCGIWTHASNNVTIQHNESHHNRTGNGGLDGAGFDFDAGVSNSIIQYNYSHDNDGAGYLMYVYEGAPYRFEHNTVRYNISHDDGLKNDYGAIYIGNDGSGVTDLRVYNNTFITTTLTERAKPQVVLIRNIASVFLINNILVTSESIPFLTLQGDNQITASHNTYWNTDGNFLVKDHEQLRSLQDWMIKYKTKQPASDSGAWQQDPKFASVPAKMNVNNAYQLQAIEAYQLTQASRLIDSGIRVDSLFDEEIDHVDFKGHNVPVGERVDVGAFEFLHN